MVHVLLTIVLFRLGALISSVWLSIKEGLYAMPLFDTVAYLFAAYQSGSLQRSYWSCLKNNRVETVF